MTKRPNTSPTARTSSGAIFTGIARSYASRSLYWVLLITALGLWWAGFQFRPHFQPVVPIARPWTQTILSQQRATMVLPQGQRAARLLEDWDWEGFRQDAKAVVLYSGPDFPMERLKAMPELRQLRLRHFHLTGHADPSAVPQALRRLAELPHLEFLALPEGTFAAEDMETWAELGELQHVEAHAATFRQGLESLPHWPKLETLSVQVRDLTPQAIAHLSRYESLHTLILHAGDVSELSLPRQTLYQEASMKHRQNIAELRQLEQLRTLYLPGREFSDFESVARAALPHLRVRPLRADIHQATAVLVCCGGSALIGLIVGLQVLAQFTIPLAHLTPHYARPHRQAAFLLLFATLPIAVTCAWYRSIDIWTVFAVNLGCLAAALHVCRPQTSRWVALFPMAFGLQFVLNLGPLPIYVRSTLAGEQPWVGAILFAVGLFAFVRWYTHGESFLPIAGEKGLPLPLYSLRNMTVAMQVSGAREAEQGGPLAGFISRDQDVRDATAHSRSQPRKLTRLPNVNNYRRVVFVMVMVYVLIRGMLVWQGRGALHASVMHLAGLLYLHFIVGIILFSRWHARRPFFGHELCRPMTRRQFTSDRFAVIAEEFLLLPAWISVVNIAFLATHLSPASVLYWGMFHALVCFSATWLMYSCCMLSLCLVRSWTIATAYVAAALLLVVSMAMAGWGSWPQLAQMQPAAVATASCLLLVPSACVLQWSRYRWREAEWALTGP